MGQVRGRKTKGFDKAEMKREKKAESKWKHFQNKFKQSIAKSVTEKAKVMWKGIKNKKRMIQKNVTTDLNM